MDVAKLRMKGECNVAKLRKKGEWYGCSVLSTVGSFILTAVYAQTCRG
jgi:hypothetical protein